MCVTQELDDLLSSPVLKESVIANCDCRILLDMRKYANKFDEIQELLGLSDKERNQVLSINRANDPMRRYKEVWIGLGGVHSAVYATETSLVILFLLCGLSVVLPDIPITHLLLAHEPSLKFCD